VLFNSPQFFVFFTIVYLLYLNLPHRAQNGLLLVASYVFYGWWDWRFLGLLFFSTTVDFFVARRIAAASDPVRRRRWLLVSLATGLGLLGFFKYYDFFVDSLELGLRGFGVDPAWLHLDLVLPIGISFYTFQSLSYTIDVYRGQLRPSRNFFDLALVVSLFPQLVAGPIERAKSLLPQVVKPRRLTPDGFRDGVYLVAWGLIKKIVIADHCALIVNQVFDDHASYGGAEQLIAVYAFAFQIYCDFSGYTDIARGIAKLMGFELMLNFDLPYFATNPSDFWRRWHISLSTWLRDYLYISLGGNRRGSFLTYRNLMITMVLGGLWHGAKWTMILWGAYHGLLLVAHRLFTEWRSRTGRAPRREPRLLAHLALAALYFQLTSFGWLIFRAESVGQVVDFVRTIATSFALTPRAEELFARLALLTAPLVAFELLQFKANDLLVWLRLRPAWQVASALYLAAASFAYWILFQSALGTAQEFIYFQF